MAGVGRKLEQRCPVLRQEASTLLEASQKGGGLSGSSGRTEFPGINGASRCRSEGRGIPGQGVCRVKVLTSTQLGTLKPLQDLACSVL